MSTPAESQRNAEYFQALVPATAQDTDGMGKSHIVAFTNTAGDSQTFHSDTTLVGLFPTQDCWVLVKESGTASAAAIPSVGAAPASSSKTAAMFLPGGVQAFIGIPKREGKTFALSVIRNSADGNLYVTEAR